MQCVCGHELIHGGDHDAESMGLDPQEWSMVSNFTCPECERHVMVYESST